MPGIELNCRIEEKIWLTPTVVTLRFEPSKKFRYEAGQFLSARVPSDARGDKWVRRCYSFSAPHGKRDNEGYELCVKVVDQGLGSNYLASLEPGDSFRASAPYGDFCFRHHPGRRACFVSTGTGIAPFRAMALSRELRENPPEHALMLFGARQEDEIIYKEGFEAWGVQTVNALSRPGPDWTGFTGRVTDYLKSLPPDWPWQSTDFYLCGNGDMVAEVRRLLRDSRNVPVSAIHQEVYFVPADRTAPVALPAAPAMGLKLVAGASK